MAANKKTKKKEEISTTEQEPVDKNIINQQDKNIINQQDITDKNDEIATDKIAEKIKKSKPASVPTPTPKHKIGSIVFISNNAEADLNGFKLFPQYKKYTYTVEAYEPKSDVYTLRRLNLSLKLKGELILAPDERAHDSIHRKQF